MNGLWAERATGVMGSKRYGKKETGLPTYRSHNLPLLDLRPTPACNNLLHVLQTALHDHMTRLAKTWHYGRERERETSGTEFNRT